MPKRAQELGPLAVKRLSKVGLHAVGGVAGLHLQISSKESRSWILRVKIGDKRRDIGLGPYPDVSLAEARERARLYKGNILQGVDPVKAKREAKSALIAAHASQKTFEQAAKEFIDAKSAEWNNPKHVQQWQNTLATYAFPVIGKMHVGDVQLSHIAAILEPIWKKKTVTASRLRGRIESVLDWATVRKYRQGENPARWKGHLDKILASPSKITKVRHHPALPADKLADFMNRLSERSEISAKALEFSILTVTRSGETRGARWDEIDLKNAVWTIPAERMKIKKRDHRVPLSKRAIELLKSLPKHADQPLVFASPSGKKFSDMTLNMLARRMKAEAVPHGFRSTFKDWAMEIANYPNEISEMALAHTIPNKAEAAYRRGDLFDKRRDLMADWATFCYRPFNKKGQVLHLRKVK